MSIVIIKLSKTEIIALDILKRNGGCIPSFGLSDTNEKGVVFSDITPGLSVFKKLEKKGLVFFTEEDPIELDDGDVVDLHPLIYLTENK